MFLKSSSLAVLFLLFLICARLLVLQSFEMDFGEESGVEVSSLDGEGEFSVFRIFLKKYCIVLDEIRLATPLLNTIKQHATMCDKILFTVFWEEQTLVSIEYFNFMTHERYNLISMDQQSGSELT